MAIKCIEQCIKSGYGLLKIIIAKKVYKIDTLARCKMLTEYFRQWKRVMINEKQYSTKE